MGILLADISGQIIFILSFLYFNIADILFVLDIVGGQF